MRQAYIICLILLLLTMKDAALAQQSEERFAFGDGEYLSFNVSYNWGFVWIDAGKVDFKAVQQQPSRWKFSSTGMSYRKFDWFFKVRDTFEVVTTEKLFPLHFRRHTHEGGYIIFNDYHFNEASKEVYTYFYETRIPPGYDTLSLETNATDVLTATYITRSLNFECLKTGDTVQIPMILDNIVFRLPIVFHGREVFTTRENQKYRSLKFSVRLEEGTMFRAGEELFVWVTDDNNRLPLMIEAKITVGSIKVYLESYQHLAHPLKSRLD